MSEFTSTDRSSGPSQQHATERTPLLPPLPTSPERIRNADVEPSGPACNATPDGATNVKIVSSDEVSRIEAVVDHTHEHNRPSIGIARGILCTCALAGLIFLQAMNISMLTTTSSDIASELDAFEKTSWFSSAYLIAMSALGPVNGKLSSIFSPRICIFISSIILAIGSVLSGLAPTFRSFVTGRAIAGVGASGIFTVSIIIVLGICGAKRRGVGIGLLNSGYTIGVALGATAAGALLPKIGWRPLFWLQAPIAVVGGLALLVAIPSNFTATTTTDDGLEAPQGTRKRLRQLDYLGALTLVATITLLLYGFSATTTISILPIILSLIVGITFVLNEVYLAIDPIIPLTLLKSRGLLLTCLGTVGYMMARWSVLFYSPTYAIAVRHWSPATAGAILIPTNAGVVIGGMLVGTFHVKRPGSFYGSALISYALFPCTVLGLALLANRNSPPAAFIVFIGACGLATGAALNYNLAHVLHITPKHTHYVATSLVVTFRGFAGSFGSAIGGGLFTRTLSESLTTQFADRGMHRDTLIRHLLGSPKQVGNLEGAEREVAITGYEQAIKTLFLACAGLAVLMVFIQAGTGWKGMEEQRRETIVDQDDEDAARALLRNDPVDDNEGYDERGNRIEHV